MLYMKRFPHLWSWRRKPSVAGMEPWQPSEVIFNDKPLPHQMRFQGARWLCAPEHMASAVRAEFGTEAGSIEPPENVRCQLPASLSVVAIHVCCTDALFEHVCRLQLSPLPMHACPGHPQHWHM